MNLSTKTAQLQVRVSPEDKRTIQHAARRAGMDMSSFVLQQVLGAHQRRVEALMMQLQSKHTRRFALAELNELLTSLSADELRRAVTLPPPATLPRQTANYIAAMVEYACGRQSIAAPAWTRSIEPLETPAFGSTLESLRLHLLAGSPPPFRRRNIYIDASIGDRV